jgi:WhiB family transcriptional regulator, redox-sensing transcriptional regulator
LLRLPEIQAEPAKAMCRTCGVQAQCLTYALEHVDVVGVSGGTSTRERAVARRQGLDAEMMIAEPER